MLFIDTKELREKGSIALLNDGSLLKAIDKEMMKVLDDIEDLSTDPEEKRKIKIEFVIKPNYARNGIALEVFTTTALAKKKVMSLTLGLEKAIDDNGHLIAYNLREEVEEAEGQQSMDGEEVVRESITLPYNNNVVDGNFKEKDKNEEDNEEQEAEEVIDTRRFDEETGELIEDNPEQFELDDFPVPDDPYAI